VLSDFSSIAYNAVGSCTTITATIPGMSSYSGQTSYTLDTKDQLTQEQSQRAAGYTSNFVFDSSGNPTAFKGAGQTFNAANQNTSNVYDGAGNPTNYKGTNCSFDPENRITSYGTVLTAGYTAAGLRA